MIDDDDILIIIAHDCHYNYNDTNLCVQFLHKTVTLIYAVKPPFSHLTTYLGSDSILCGRDAR